MTWIFFKIIESPKLDCQSLEMISFHFSWWFVSTKTKITDALGCVVLVFWEHLLGKVFCVSLGVQHTGGQNNEQWIACVKSQRDQLTVNVLEILCSKKIEMNRLWQLLVQWKVGIWFFSKSGVTQENDIKGPVFGVIFVSPNGFRTLGWPGNSHHLSVPCWLVILRVISTYFRDRPSLFVGCI